MRLRSKLHLLAATGIAALTATHASAATLGFDAQANIFGAGLSSLPSAAGGEGVLPPSLSVTGGQVLIISVSGSSNPGGGYPTAGPGGFVTASNIMNVTGSTIGDWASPNAMTVLGVFTGIGAGVDTLFAVGTGGTFVAPAGATAFYLGFADAFAFQGTSGYYADNVGQFTASISAVPEPATWLLLIAGFGMAGASLRARRAKVRFRPA